MAEFLHRRINVAIPEVDVGDDVFVVKGTDDTVTRVQVKAATATAQSNGHVALFNVPLAQLSVPNDTPSLVYVFAVRYGNRWSDFVVIRRSRLFELYSEGAGTRIVDDRGNPQAQFRIVFRESKGLCGPDEAANFQEYRDAWEPWPPPHVTGTQMPVPVNAPQAPI